MPTYIYKCQSCEKVFEVRQRISADPLSECPKDICPKVEEGKDCDGTPKRQVAGGAFHLKGGGWADEGYS